MPLPLPYQSVRCCTRIYAYKHTARSSAALDDIAKVGPAGHFLEAASTLENYRTAYFESDIFPNLTVDDWRRQRQPRADERLRSYTETLMASLHAPDDHADLIGRGEEFIRRQFTP